MAAVFSLMVAGLDEMVGADGNAMTLMVRLATELAAPSVVNVVHQMFLVPVALKTKGMDSVVPPATNAEM